MTLHSSCRCLVFYSQFSFLCDVLAFSRLFALQRVRTYVRAFPGRWGRDLEMLRRASKVLPPGTFERDGLSNVPYDCLARWGVALSAGEQVRLLTKW